ncbi:choline ABC transporter ATP-binding protein [Enterovibrio norvegicus]|uniref:Glycine betaine/proline transport system ATP-binding protein n=2 Tax=Enterovibrio norvegicus TaxID=188144 RepID=A0A1I5LWK3_9GAMM|nr:choline ABC transporter ATP-binding protein [Enterovibrio norvegicus]MCC4798460.1 choline ABC transporter ATP-binding protein [Enterovibrio norvegicus]OEE43624.1 choline ABC transporter ATP-binding protein [Enterovibrio norvegicus]OEF57142.1 choline ABC transporter ATP-binding protein [Enterovibrio norvegicus]OEF61025.1 choline ABC transporter ATP-binding protein [Enterovibrio norvegicus]PMH64904.1 choline ABC transporter ATP-binding protein [Enterovibrio norvegicus]
MNALTINNLDVVFGQSLDKSLALLDEGKTRQEIQEATGDVVGVHNASLTVEKGEICVLMGLSGSGKSSLLRAVNGLNPVTRGSLEVNLGDDVVNLAGIDEKSLRDLRSHRISMVFQKFALMPWLSVVDNVAFGLEMQGMGKTERRKHAEDKLELVGLSEWKDKFPHELSGGMQQRVGLARAFTMDSDILLMDEPFSALDPLIRNQLQDELIELQRKLNKTIVFVSHDLDEALKIGTNIAIMESGKIIQHGKPEDIVLRPENQYVEDFVAHTNPLNVLRGRSLMTSLSDLTRVGDTIVLKRHEQTVLKTNEQGLVVRAQRQEQDLPLVKWSKGDSIEALAVDSVVLASADISMRHALEIRYQTGQPVLLSENEKVIGVLCDNDFYHALLGKHFSQAA